MNAGYLTGWLTVAGLGLVAWIFWRGAGGTAINSLQTANRVLEKRVHDLEAQAKDDSRRIAELRARTDITLSVQPLLEAVMRHESQAQERYEKTTAVLAAIASRLAGEAA